MTAYSRHNEEVISRRLRSKGIMSATAKGSFLRFAERLWESVSRWIDSGGLSFSNVSYNLRDSIACGVYENGVLLKLFTFSPKGTNKIYHYHGMRLRADGLRLVQSTFYNRPYSAPGVHIVFRCPLNYGFFLEHGLGPDSLAEGGNRSKKAFGWWSDELVPFINQEYRRLLHEIVTD